MGDRTGIEWTDATWNPVLGCTKVSAGCDHCYAERVTNRFRGPGAFDTVTLKPERLLQPIKWQRPRRIFVNSMSDLFHTDVPDDYIADVFGVMAATPRHTYQVLTKRHARMRALLRSLLFRDAVLDRILRDDPGAQARFTAASWPLRNVWLGVSVEDQHWANIRVPALLGTPAAVRFLSAEPLLGPVELWLTCGHHANLPGRDPIRLPCCDAVVAALGWVIVGGESGPGARPMHPDWALGLRDECVTAGVPFLFKQWGEWAPKAAGGVALRDVCLSYDGERYDVDDDYVCAHNESEGAWLRRVGKKAAGRDLEGRTWDEYPEAVTAGV